MQMLLQSTTEKWKITCKCFYNLQLKNEKWNTNTSTMYNWKTKKEMQVLLQSITVERKIKCDSFSINNWRTKNEIQILLQSTTSKRKKRNGSAYRHKIKTYTKGKNSYQIIRRNGYMIVYFDMFMLNKQIID